MEVEEIFEMYWETLKKSPLKSQAAENEDIGEELNLSINDEKTKQETILSWILEFATSNPRYSKIVRALVVQISSLNKTLSQMERKLFISCLMSMFELQLHSEFESGTKIFFSLIAERESETGEEFLNSQPSQTFLNDSHIETYHSSLLDFQKQAILHYLRLSPPDWDNFKLCLDRILPTFNSAQNSEEYKKFPKSFFQEQLLLRKELMNLIPSPFISQKACLHYIKNYLDNNSLSTFCSKMQTKLKKIAKQDNLETGFLHQLVNDVTQGVYKCTNDTKTVKENELIFQTSQNSHVFFDEFFSTLNFSTDPTQEINPVFCESSYSDETSPSPPFHLKPLPIQSQASAPLPISNSKSLDIEEEEEEFDLKNTVMQLNLSSSPIKNVTPEIENESPKRSKSEAKEHGLHSTSNRGKKEESSSVKKEKKTKEDELVENSQGSTLSQQNKEKSKIKQKKTPEKKKLSSNKNQRQEIQNSKKTSTNLINADEDLIESSEESPTIIKTKQKNEQIEEMEKEKIPKKGTQKNTKKRKDDRETQITSEENETAPTTKKKYRKRLFEDNQDIPPSVGGTNSQSSQNIFKGPKIFKAFSQGELLSLGFAPCEVVISVEDQSVIDILNFSIELEDSTPTVSADSFVVSSSASSSSTYKPSIPSSASSSISSSTLSSGKIQYRKPNSKYALKKKK